MKGKTHRKKNPKSSIRSWLALCGLALLMSASLWLPQALIQWQNKQILGVFHPQPQQQTTPSTSRLGLGEKLSLLSGGIFYSGLQSYFPNQLPYWLDLDYNYTSLEEDYQAAVKMSANITISPLLTGNRYTPESVLPQCWGQLDRLAELGLIPLPDTEQPWDTSIQPLLYLSRSAPSHTLIVWQICLKQEDCQLWVSLDDESGLILYLQYIGDNRYDKLDSALIEIETGAAKLDLWADYWGVTMEDCQSQLMGTPKDWNGYHTAVYRDQQETFLFSAQITPTFFTMGCLTTDLERQRADKTDLFSDETQNPYPIEIVPPDKG